MKKQLNNFQSWLFKPVVSAIVFLSLIVLGGVAIIAWNSNPSSLSSLKSGANNQKLTAQNWDALVDYVAGMDTDVQGKLSQIDQKIIQISGSITNNGGNNGNTTNSDIWNKNGTNIFYNSGNVGIGINNPSVKLQVSGNIIANAPTASNHVATKKYVDDKKLSPQYMYVGLNSTNAMNASLTYTVNDVDFCIINSVMYSIAGSAAGNTQEYCYAAPATKTDRSLPNATEIYSRETLGRTNRKLYVGGNDDDQIDCGFICIRL